MPPDAQKRLTPFYRHTGAKDFKMLLGSEKEMTLDMLRDLLLDTDLGAFDPVAEAFKVRWLLSGSRWLLLLLGFLLQTSHRTSTNERVS